MKIKLKLFCETIILDSRNNILSIINLMEGIKPFGFPANIPKFTFLLILQRESTEKNEYNGNLVLTNNTHNLFNGPITLNFQGGLETRLILEVNGILIHESGKLNAKVIIDGIDLTIEEEINIEPALNVKS